MTRGARRGSAGTGAGGIIIPGEVNTADRQRNLFVVAMGEAFQKKLVWQNSSLTGCSAIKPETESRNVYKYGRFAWLR